MADSIFIVISLPFLGNFVTCPFSWEKAKIFHYTEQNCPAV